MGIEYAFVPVPHALLYDPRISLGAKVVYAFSKSRCLDKNYCLIGQERLAKEMGLGLRTVERYIAELKSFGLIETRQRMGTSAVTYFLPMSDLYAECSVPFESHPLDADPDPAKSDGSARQIRRGDSATGGGEIPPGVADKEEEDEEETEDNGADLMDLLEEDPLIQQAAEHEAGQRKKGAARAKKRLSQPSRGKKVPIVDDVSRYMAGPPGNISDPKAWPIREIYSAFKRCAEAQGMDLGSRRAVNIENVGTILQQLTNGARMSRAKIWEFLFGWLLSNWQDVSKSVFNKRGDDERLMTISLGLVSTRLSDILNLRDKRSPDRRNTALKKLGSKVKHIKL